MNLADFQKVNYSLFRKALSGTASSKIKNKGRSTLLLSQNNKVIAIMQAAGIDRSGHTHPPRYFIKPTETIAA